MDAVVIKCQVAHTQFMSAAVPNITEVGVPSSKSFDDSGSEYRNTLNLPQVVIPPMTPMLWMRDHLLWTLPVPETALYRPVIMIFQSFFRM